MNVSGRPIKSAWRTFQGELQPKDKGRAFLVVLHDELEKPLGQVKLKMTGSPQGHNGITSIIEALNTKVRLVWRMTDGANGGAGFHAARYRNWEAGE